MKGGSGERLRSAAFGPQTHTRVAGDEPTESFISRAVTPAPLGGFVNPDDEVVQRAAQYALDRLEQCLGVGVTGHHGHQILRHRKAPTGLCLPKAVVRDQLRNLGALQFQAGLLAAARRCARTLMPAHRVTCWDEHATACESAVAELGVLAPPLGECLVVTAHQLEERAGHAQIAPRDDTEEVISVGRQIVGARHVELDPFRPVDGATLEQLRQRSFPVPDAACVDSGNVDVRSKTESQDVAGGMVPTRMFSQPTRFGHHVAVQEHDDVVRGGPDTGIACACKAEAQVFLMHDADFERGWRRRPQRLT